MNMSFKVFRFALSTAAVVFGVIALLIATIVIPPVQNDTFPFATPERAATAFWVSVVLHFFIGILLVFNAIRFSDSSRGRPGVLGAFSILFGLALLDAAVAFQAHGPALVNATTCLWICAVADFLAGVLLITTAVLLRKRKETNPSTAG